MPAADDDPNETRRVINELAHRVRMIQTNLISSDPAH